MVHSLLVLEDMTSLQLRAFFAVREEHKRADIYIMNDDAIKINLQGTKDEDLIFYMIFFP
jgi:hypothetical protein